MGFKVRKEIPQPAVEYFSHITALLKGCDIVIDVLQGVEPLLAGDRTIASFTMLNGDYEIILGYNNRKLCSAYFFNLDELQKFVDEHSSIFEMNDEVFQNFVTTLYMRKSADEVVPLNDIIAKINAFIDGKSTGQA